ncbi:hypothetical protein [Tessaracoccus massiliensis]|uniref:hypothetical protein n=1 Tax=Tessaracoccus massiliensis TaxID=1522311 RepID=UPI00058F377E|nr:hypothetical protein [Tessaracoccus massiliensis]
MTAHATTEKDGSAIVTLNGQPQKVIGASLEDARRKVASIVVDHAAATGEVVEFITTEPDGTWEMIVHPDGTIHEKPEPVASPYLRPSTETIKAETPIDEDTAARAPQAPGLCCKNREA